MVGTARCAVWSRQRVDSTLDARSATAGAAGVFHRSSFRLDLRDPGAAFYFHDLIPQKRGALEFQVRRSMLHFLFKLTQQLSQIEIAPSFLNNRSGNFASAQDCMQTLLHGALDSPRRNAVLFVVFHLPGTPILGDRN